jgi:hypothetical protein
MTRQISRSAYILILAALLGLVAGTLGADKLDFSGSYTLKKTTSAAKPAKGEVWVLRVSQSESAIEVTRVLNGHKYVNKFPLDGSEGTYVSPGGPTGTCKGQLKSKYLILESFVTSHPQLNGPAVQMHTKERWELSSDLNALRIRTDVDFPQFSGTLNGFQVVEPWSETYVRN